MTTKACRCKTDLVENKEEEKGKGGDHECVLYIVPHRIQRKRLVDIKEAVRRKRLPLADELSDEVSHIVTEYESLEQVSRAMKGDLEGLADREVVRMSWLTACLKAGKLVPVEETHRLTRVQSEQDDGEQQKKTESSSSLAEWACMRITPLKHHNEPFTKALEILQQHAELRDSDQDYSRALAFRRASCVLKSLPHRVTSLQQLSGCKDIGGHSKRVIQEILEDGSCDEVDRIENDPWFQKMKLFSSIFGVGPSTAKKWIEKGWSTVQDAQNCDSISNDWRVIWGLAFHEDLTRPVPALEAQAFLQVVKEEAAKIRPGVIVELTGGFRRGKESGHDVDILLTHRQEGAEEGLLPQLLKSLETRGLVLCGNSEKNSFSPDVLAQDFKLSARGQLDHFEKWLGICKFPPSFRIKPSASLPSQTSAKAEEQGENGEGKRPEAGASTTSGQGDTDTHKAKESPPSGSWDDTSPPPCKSKRMTVEGLSPLELSQAPRDWFARRVDLIVAPYSQYFYALVGWTGNKQYNRDLRLYASRALGMKLTSHGLFEQHTGRALPASSEREVFSNLKVPYREPWERNC